MLIKLTIGPARQLEDGQIAEPDEPVEVSKDLGERLLEQDIWKPATKKEKS